MNPKDTTYELVVEDIWRVATALEKHPLAMSRGEYLTNSNYGARVMDSFGGYSNILKDNFEAVGSKATATIRANTTRRNYIRKLENEVGDRNFLADELVRSVERAFTAKPIKFTNHKHSTKKKATGRENVVLISDTHFGLRVDRNEVPCNSFDWTVAARRMAKLAVQTAEFKKEHRAECDKLTICLGGDMIQGIIHLSEANLDLVTDQIHGAASILTQFIEHQRQFYRHIDVQTTAGNHDRFTHKDAKRAIAQRSDSFSTLLYRTVEAAFKNQKNIKFFIPKTPFTDFRVLGHRFLLNHGDSFLKSGNVSNSVNVGKISSAIRAIQAANPGDKIAAFLMGHVHTPLVLGIDGVKLVVNGCLSGTDTYAQSLGITVNQPSQTLFEVTQSYAVGDYRVIDVGDADTDKSYDAIIAV